MIEIGICDDSTEQGKALNNVIEKYMKNTQTVYQCMRFENSKALLYEIQDGHSFDLLLLDIEMPELNGIELTEQIKTLLPDVLIIFVSAYEKYVYDSFRVQPFRFIPKSRSGEMLDLALEDAVREILRCENLFYHVENQRGIEKLPVKSIVYIWHREKYAYIEKTDGEQVKVRKTLKQVYEELPKELFVWLDRSYICNLSHIESIKGDSVKLSTGEILQISRDRAAALKNQVRDYWLS